VIAALAAFFVLSASTPANADDPAPPRAAPVPRAAPRAEAQPSVGLGYDKLEQYSFDVAADLTALDSTAREVATQREAAIAQLVELELLSNKPTAIRDRLERTAVKFSFKSMSLNTLSQPEREAVDFIQTLRTQLRQRVDALSAQAADLAAAGSDKSPRPERIWVSPAQGEITQPFGSTRVRVEPARTYQSVYYAHFHDGIDVGATWGAPVVAAAPGKVVFAGRMNDGNWMVLIAHLDGFVTMYAHLDPRFAVAAGDYVTMGQQIGTVASTGISTGPHLHFSVWHDGTLVDPMTRFRL